MPPRPASKSYLSRLIDELESLHGDYQAVLDRSAVVNVDPNRGGSGVAFIGYAKWAWASSEPELEVALMALLGAVRDWAVRFRLMFPHPTQTTQRRLDTDLGLLERWLERPARAKDVPGSIDRARQRVDEVVADLRGLVELLPGEDPHPVRLVTDTNTLLDNPDLAAHIPTLGPSYLAHVPTVVFSELDELKRSGRNQEVREAAKAADRRLKGLRNNGDVRAGARVAGNVWTVFEYTEPRGDGLPTWLDLDVPDDRFVASCLQLQTAHPAATVHVATGDLNLQNKLSAVGLPFVELP